MANPIFGVTMALEEERANSADVDDAAISGVKIGMMGPLAGAGDPLFWFTLRPILLSLGASLAVSGNVLGPLLFFILWNIMAAAVKWYTQEFGYKAGVSITDDDWGCFDDGDVCHRGFDPTLGLDHIYAGRVPSQTTKRCLYRMG